MNKLLITIFMSVFTVTCPFTALSQSEYTPKHCIELDSGKACNAENESLILHQIKNMLKNNYAPDTISRIDPHKITQYLNLKPNMEILDLGAGYGAYTFFFAKNVPDLGKIYATDIDAKRIKFIQDTSKEMNLNNIEAVTVQPFGLDPFYSQHSFDLIFISEVFYQMFGLQNKSEYFKVLLPSLKENGQLCMIEPQYYFDFNGYFDLRYNGAFKTLIGLFKEKGEDFPIFKRLSENTKTFILTWDDEGVKAIPQEARENLLKDLNNILKDKSLLMDVLHYVTPDNLLTRWGGMRKAFPKNTRMINHLTRDLMTHNAFDKTTKLTEDDQNHLLLLNRLIMEESLNIAKQYRFDFTSPDNNILVGKKEIIRTLSAAGYQFVGGHELGTSMVLIFSPAK